MCQREVGGLKLNQAKRLKELERENGASQLSEMKAIGKEAHRPKKIVADLDWTS